MGAVVQDADVKNLVWMRAQLGKECLDAVILHTGPRAYRRYDGIAVVPAALLGAWRSRGRSSFLPRAEGRRAGGGGMRMASWRWIASSPSLPRGAFGAGKTAVL